MSGATASNGDGSITRHVRFKEIVVVETDETWALALRDALVEDGYRVSPVLGIYEAARRIRRNPGDLFLVSALLGEQESETLLRELESARVSPRVLLVGSRTAEARWAAWSSLPYMSVVGQPFTLEDVRSAARAILGEPWVDLAGGDDSDSSAF